MLSNWVFVQKDNGLGGFQIECRKNNSGPVVLTNFDNRNYSENAQVLIIVSDDGWKWKNTRGEQGVRLSMNGVCVMELGDLQEMADVVEFAQQVLAGKEKLP